MDLLSDLKVRFEFKSLRCGAGADVGARSNPYLWTVFFKLDGESLMVSDPDEGVMVGEAVVHAPSGSHGNLGVDSVEAGETVAIPASVGSFSTVLRVIPVQGHRDGEGVRAVMGGVGALAVLREADERDASRTVQRHAALRRRVQQVLDALIRSRSANHKTFSEREVVDALATQWEPVVREGEQWVINPDDTLGAEVWFFSHAALATQSAIRLNAAWGEEPARWVLSGAVRVEHSD